MLKRSFLWAATNRDVRQAVNCDKESGEGSEIQFCSKRMGILVFEH